MAMKPLHQAIFKILEAIPSDSTMDQDRSINRGKRLLGKAKYAASFDLSAATDRLPISIQKSILDGF